ncbi:MAG: carbon starvation protein A [Lachnospirales bacterium]
MVLFVLGIVILIVGYFVYGKFVENLFEPDDRPTPALRLEDGVDFVPMNITQNALVQLLNIAGTGPIFGPIAGVLWGPIAFILIPIGNIFAGSVHDYLSGMLSVRENGAQITVVLKKYLGNGAYQAFNLLLLVLLVLVGAVFVTIPGNIILYNFFGISSVTGISEFFSAPAVWIFGAIFIYYIIATLLPIDKVIGKIYPIFGAALIVSSLGVLLAIFFKDGWAATINEFATFSNISLNGHPKGLPLFPLFFTTIACGIISGFHASQAPLIARTIKHEREGRIIFFGMMVLEGVIAMIWAAAGVIARNFLMVEGGSTTVIVEVSKAALPSFLATIAIIGLIVLPLTSGDTALRGARLTIADYLNKEQKSISSRLVIALPMFILTFAIVIWGKVDAAGFDSLWRYFAWANQAVAVFILFTLSMYFYVKFKGTKKYLLTLIPGIFYSLVIFSYLFGGNATREIAAAAGEPAVVNKASEIGFMLGYTENAFLTYGLAALCTAICVFLFFKRGKAVINDSNFKVS